VAPIPGCHCVPSKAQVPISRSSKGIVTPLADDSALISPFLHIRPVDPMHQFGNGEGTQSGLRLAPVLDDLLEELGNIELLSFGLDNNTRLEDYSQDGGFPGWLRLAMPSSTSFIKPSSSVTMDPRASASAMHSDSIRPRGTGERMTATGR
jgi:hypothetical protein